MKSEKAPTSGESDYVPPSEDPKSVSVLDFLYHDYRRIASFLAQFQTYGVLQQVKATEFVGRIGTRKTTTSAGVDLLTVAKGGIASEDAVSDDERESAERTYDPLWTNARTLLDYLETADLICRDITKGHLGQFVIASGALSILNTALIKKRGTLQLS